MSDLIVVKHAAPEIVKDIASARWVLSETGRQQCHDLCDRLAPFRPAHILASQEPKAGQTAEILGTTLGVPVLLTPGLQENDRTGFPFFDDPAELNERIRAFFTRPGERVIGTESADEAHERFSSAVRVALASSPERPTLVVTHGTVTSLLVARANQLDPYDFWLDFDLTSFAVLSIPGYALQQVVHPGDH